MMSAVQHVYSLVRAVFVAFARQSAANGWVHLTLPEDYEATLQFSGGEFVRAAPQGVEGVYQYLHEGMHLCKTAAQLPLVHAGSSRV